MLGGGLAGFGRRGVLGHWPPTCRVTLKVASSQRRAERGKALQVRPLCTRRPLRHLGPRTHARSRPGLWNSGSALPSADDYFPPEKPLPGLTWDLAETECPTAGYQVTPRPECPP